MPYQSENTIIPPETAVSHQGVSVYHTYRSGEAEEGHRTFWFTLNSDDLIEPDHFDVRTLSPWSEPLEGADEDEHIKTVLRRAIEAGELASP